MKNYNAARLASFRTMYAIKLTNAVTDSPGQYDYDPEQVPVVVGRMFAAIEAKGLGAVNKAGALEKTMRELCGKSTYKAMEAWLMEGAK